MGEEEKPQSWWKTIPGILTAITAFITAITGLVLTLQQTGMFRRVQEPSKATTQALAAPVLLSPRNGEILPHPYMGSWHFKWDETAKNQQILQYHLIVIRGTGYITRDVKTEQKSDILEWRSCNFIQERDRFNWKWKVRAQNQEGEWSPWSEEFSFDVREFNQQEYAEKCPSARKPIEPVSKPAEPPLAPVTASHHLPSQASPPQAGTAAAPARLTGDDIISIKIVSQDDCRIYFEVAYFINPARSADVWVYGWLSYQGKGSQTKPNCPKGGGGMMRVEHLGKGTARLSMGIPENGKTDSVEVFMREGSKTFFAKKIPFNRKWQ
jgi:hypothetical protein